MTLNHISEKIVIRLHQREWPTPGLTSSFSTDSTGLVHSAEEISRAPWPTWDPKMASGSASSPRPAPDENEFPFGCPPTVCQDPSEPRALCCTACLSENVRNGEDPICAKCRGHDPQSVSPGSLLSQEKQFEAMRPLIGALVAADVHQAWPRTDAPAFLCSCSLMPSPVPSPQLLGKATV